MRAALTVGAGWLLLTAFVVQSATAQVAVRDATSPNIVILFADDMGYGDLGSYGHPTIKTPVLDRMAGEGIRMTSMYAAAPICTPSRASILTGRYATRVGLPRVLGPESTTGLPGEEVTIAEALGDVGYRTMAVGKWHLGHAREEFLPTGSGFDDYFGLLYSNDMIPPWSASETPLRLYRGASALEGEVDQASLTRRYTEEAARFIENGGDEPYFLYLSYTMPHIPLYASPEMKGRSRAGLYGDVIEEIDWSVGRVLDAIDSTGEANNTIIVFTSDNGPWLDPGEVRFQGGVEPWDFGSPGPFRGAKLTSYEAGVRVPGIIRWPARIPAARMSAEIATTMDLYTTLIAAAGGRIPTDRTVDGNDLLPLLEGTTEISPTQRFFYVLRDTVEGVREGPWKLRTSSWKWIDGRPDAPETQVMVELFNLEIDPSETHDVAPDHPRLVARLSQILRDFAEDADAVLPAGFPPDQDRSAAAVIVR